MEEAKIEKELKKNKKKNKVASLLLALALILTCGVAGTIAQYQKSLGGSSTATVAKFSVSASNLGDPDSTTFNLFDNVSDTNSLQTDGVEGDVAKIGGNGTDKDKLKIAPGTQGYFETKLTNGSDVNVSYTLDTDLVSGTGELLKGTLAGQKIPLEFAITTTKPTTQAAFNALSWTKLGTTPSTTSGASASLVKKTGTLDMKGGTTPSTTAYICWRWPYKGSDAAVPESDSDRIALDTAIGEAIGDNDTFKAPEAKVTVVFAQVD